jgi:hypothetical protein
MRLSAFLRCRAAAVWLFRSTEEVRETPPSPRRHRLPLRPRRPIRVACWPCSARVSRRIRRRDGAEFPGFLQKNIDAEKYPWRVVNLGISGDTTEGGVSRIDSAVSLKPEIVILERAATTVSAVFPPDTKRAES